MKLNNNNMELVLLQKCDRVRQLIFIKCNSSGYYKVRQIFLQNVTDFIKKYDDYYKVRRKLEFCLWVDDVVIIAISNIDLQKMRDISTEFLNNWKHDYNYDKSKVMVIGKKERIDKQMEPL